MAWDLKPLTEAVRLMEESVARIARAMGRNFDDAFAAFEFSEDSGVNTLDIIEFETALLGQPVNVREVLAEVEAWVDEA